MEGGSGHIPLILEIPIQCKTVSCPENIVMWRYVSSHQLLTENKLYSLNSTLNMSWIGNLDSSIGKSARIVIWISKVRIPLKVQLFLLKSKLKRVYIKF